MKLLARYNTLACLTVYVAILCYTVAERNLTLALLATPVTIAGWWTARKPGESSPWTLPRGVVNLLVLVAVINSFSHVFLLGEHGALVSDLSEFLVYIQLIKLFDRRKARDEAQMLSLSVFIVIGAILTNNSLGVGVTLLIYTPLATFSMMLLQVYAGQRMLGESRSEAGLESARPPAVTGVRTGRQFRRLAAGAIVSSLMLSAVVFLIMPRGFGTDTFGSFGKPLPGSQVGFTDHVRLGLSGLISDSPRPVMDVQLIENGRVQGAPNLTLYLRGTVQDRYDPSTGTWSRSMDDAQSTINREKQPADVPVGGMGSGRDFDAELRVHLLEARSPSGYFFTMWRPVRLIADETMDVSTPVPGGDMVVRYFDSPTRDLSYRVWSSRDLAGPVAGDTGALGAATVPRTFWFSGGRIHDLAVSILTRRGIPVEPNGRGPPDNRAAVNAFQSYLRQTCTYTLAPDPPPAGAEPIEWFIFTRKAGHCEYFASALTAMCWSIGIDARVVAGYVATEFDRSSGHYLVRESNAHAWVEAKLAPGRWAQFDPTPPADLDRVHRASPGLIGRLRRYYEQVEFGWATTIVSFDASRRADLYDATLGRSKVIGQIRDWISALSEKVRSLLSVLPLPKSVVGWVATGLTALLLFASVALVYRSLSRLVLVRRPRRRRPAPNDPQLRQLLHEAGFYQHALSTLRRAGLAKPDSTPPIDHAAALAQRDEALGEAFGRIARAYYQIRFGRRRLDDAAQSRIEADGEAIRRRLAALPAVAQRPPDK